MTSAFVFCLPILPYLVLLFSCVEAVLSPRSAMSPLLFHFFISSVFVFAFVFYLLFQFSCFSSVPRAFFESVNLCLFISCFILLVSRLLCHVCNFASLVLLPQWVPAVFPGVSHLPNYLVCIYCLSPVCLLLCLLHMVCVSLHRAPCVFLLEFCCKVKLSSKSYLLSPTLGSTSCLHSANIPPPPKKKHKFSIFLKSPFF